MINGILFEEWDGPIYCKNVGDLKKWCERYRLIFGRNIVLHPGVEVNLLCDSDPIDCVDVVKTWGEGIFVLGKRFNWNGIEYSNTYALAKIISMANMDFDAISDLMS
jgi:hypothetical protein